MFDQLAEALETEYVPSFSQPKQRKFGFKKDPPAVKESREPSPTVSHRSNNEFMLNETLKRDTPSFSLSKSPPMENPDLNLTKKQKLEDKEWDIKLPEEVFKQSFSRQQIPDSPVGKSRDVYVGRGMKPPMSSKSHHNESKESFWSRPKEDTQPKQHAKQESSKNIPQQSDKIVDFRVSSLKKMLEEQKNEYEKRLEEKERRFEQQKQVTKSQHQQELRSRLELKDLEATRMRDLHQFEIKSRLESQTSTHDITKLVNRLEEKISSLEKLNNNLQSSKPHDPSASERISREMAELEEKRSQLKSKETEIQKYEKEVRNQILEEKKALTNEYKRLQQLQESVISKERKAEAESLGLREKMDRELEETRREYQEKMKHLELERDSLNHQKKLTTELQQTFQSKHKELLDQTYERLRELNYEKLQVEEKSMELERQLKQLEIGRNEVEHLREELKNKMQIIDLERQRFRGEGVGSASHWQQSRAHYMASFENTKDAKDLKGDTNSSPLVQPSKYPQSDFKKSLTSLKDDYLRSLQGLKLR